MKFKNLPFVSQKVLLKRLEKRKSLEEKVKHFESSVTKQPTVHRI